tara:strand:- start:21711 stop:22283 length:573 start_codon:yes stop_codon:yes gene_type:complete
MRIDEVIVNEKPVGMLGKMGNFIQRNVGTAASKARGQGKTQQATMANQLHKDLNVELGKRQISPTTFKRGGDPEETKQYTTAVLNYLSRSFDPALIKKLGTAYVNSVKDKADAGGWKGGNTRGQVLSKATDLLINELITGSLKNNLPIGGDATGDTPNNMGSEEQQAVAAVAKLSKEAQQAIKDALNGSA